MIKHQLERCWDALSDAEVDLEDIIERMSNLDENGEERIISVKDTMDLIKILREIEANVKKAKEELK